MFDVIDFLESVGQDALWRHAEPEVLTAALTGARISPELQMAILAKDRGSIAILLGTGPFCCYINPAKEDEDEGDKDEDDPGDKGKEDKKGNDKTIKTPTKKSEERR
jgi:hypothetical protein